MIILNFTVKQNSNITIIPITLIHYFAAVLPCNPTSAIILYENLLLYWYTFSGFISIPI